MGHTRAQREIEVEQQYTGERSADEQRYSKAERERERKSNGEKIKEEGKAKSYSLAAHFSAHLTALYTYTPADQASFD